MNVIAHNGICLLFGNVLITSSLYQETDFSTPPVGSARNDSNGKFTAAFVTIDNWEHPSQDLKPEIFHLTADKSQILCIPEGYANGFQAEEPDSILLVFSNKIGTVVKRIKLYNELIANVI